MKISTKGRYALRMLVDLAQHREEGYISLKEISDRQDISKKYLEQIVPMLNKSGVLRTNRGNRGGYMLAMEPADCSVGDVLRATEGNLAPVTCLEYEQNDCPRAASCATLFIWEGLYHTTRAGWAPMVPMTYTAPMRMDEGRMELLRSTILRVLQGAGIRFGQFNIEGYFTHTGEFFIIEINARQGGNFLPCFLRRFTGIDYNRLLVTTCVKEEGYINEVATSERPHRFAMMSSVYSQKAGVYQGLAFDPLIRDKIKDVRQLVSAGEAVEKCIDGTSIVASIDLEFDSMEELDAFTPLVVDGIRVRIV